MSKVPVRKEPGATQPVWTLFDDMRRVFDELQQRAFSLFEARNGLNGEPMDDWLRAERERFLRPASELSEDEQQLHVKAAVPGLQAKEIQVTATPRELVIRGETSKRDEGKRGNVHFCELSEKQLFRRYELPSEVDVSKVAANLEDGMLTIDMPKIATGRKIQVSEKGAKTKRIKATAA